MKSNTLYFAFDDAPGNKQSLLFTNPIEIYVATKTDQVIDVLKKAQAAVDRGKYVAGYLSYESAPAFEPHYRVNQDSKMPYAWFAVFNEPNQSELPRSDGDYTVSDWEPRTSYSEYQTAIQSIKKGIERGDTYQVNYTTRLRATFTGDDFAFYRQLANNQQASYSAYLRMDRYSILSASPELFFQVKDNIITTKPMKGTVKRGRTQTEDLQHQGYLKTSEKERAENLMIVDLLRNDIGKIAKSGSVHVPELLTIEKYPTVHQMTSTVRATLQDGLGLTDWMKALFPCGSITGAPKMKTMEYIDQLEDTPREVYCGAIGFVTPEKQAIFNVPIRTVVIDRSNQEATYGVGGGITWDSTANNEYQEMATKAKLLTSKQKPFSLLESLLLIDKTFPLLDYHLKRLQTSASYYDYSFNREEVKKSLEKVADKHSNGSYKVRLLLDRVGRIEVAAERLVNPETPISCVLAENPIDSSVISLYHKTTDRSIYQKHEKVDPVYFSTLLWNEREEVTEFTIGNIVVEKNGKKLTPPVFSGLLPGTYRQYLLDKGEIIEQSISLSELETAEKIWLINGVRGWVEVSLSK